MLEWWHNGDEARGGRLAFIGTEQRLPEDLRELELIDFLRFALPTNRMRRFRILRAFNRARQPHTPLLPFLLQTRFHSKFPEMVDTEPNVASTASLPSCQTPQVPTESSTAEKPLPKLSTAEFHAYNHMAEHMDYFHNHFRETWNLLYTACETQKRPKGMSIRQFLGVGQEFVRHLTTHHTIEERHIFPILARKMPAFQKELELLTQHKQIHKGLDKLEEYLEGCRSGERELRMRELKDILDGFGKVLWQHLDDEVAQLGAENMRKYWTIEEMRRMPM
ncbi:uncharacterized protein BDR25DRAFT_392221 [Lindgomyces ingoldianus]|uniref:Uncharacterized protein n=1 Tax=Lindgomyces ingoldianus TaxID=673940 RepID=A0ACB6R646_9PLEO|nr:uncharacterized protein BDR25DRAFT_392221 [Lindgomyces ingoldianus]KAF2473780.1 hypothetical protein BDR25DRAFT_392221 [Lindgomyces ingoldianus]